MDRAPPAVSAILGILTGLLSGVPLAGQEPAPASLTLDRAVELALRNNPAHLATRNDRRVADWDIRSAYGSLLPSFDIGSSISWQGPGEQRFGSLTTEQLGFGDQPSFYFSSYSLGLSYTIDGATLMAPGEARARRDATGARIRSSAAGLTQAVTAAYLEVLRQDEEVRLARQELERARANLRLATGQRDVGSATELDVSRARIEVGRAEVAILRAENGAHTSRVALHRQLGTSPPEGEPVTLTTELELFEPPWTEEDLYAEALEHNPGLSELRATRNAADRQVGIARSAYLPRISLQAGLSGFSRGATNPSFFVEQARRQRGQQIEQCEALNMLFTRLDDPLPTQDCSTFELDDEDAAQIRDEYDSFPFGFTDQPTQASLTVSIPIFQGLGRQRELEAAKVEREDTRYRIQEQELVLRADIASGLAAVRTARESARIEAENQQVADEQLRLAREQYRLGQISFVELAEAETVKAQADREHLTALFGFHEALANLEAVVGRSLRDESEEGP